MTTDPLHELRRYGDDLRNETSPWEARARLAPLISARRVRIRRRTAAIALAAAMTLVVANLGLAALADGAAPGDLLYGVDLAYEKVTQTLGLGRNPNMERLEEAGVLANRGRAADALVLVQAALGETEQAQAVGEARLALTSLDDAPDLLDTAGPPFVGDFDALVEAIIEAARAEVGVGSENGGSVRDAALDLRDAIRASTPGGPPEDPPGPPEEVPPVEVPSPTGPPSEIPGPGPGASPGPAGP